jgi:hypothetical protein
MVAVSPFETLICTDQVTPHHIPEECSSKDQFSDRYQHTSKTPAALKHLNFEN